MNLIRMTATRGDGSENWYRGVVTPRVQQIIDALNDNLDEMITVDPIDEDTDQPQQPNPSEVCTVEDETVLVDSLVWWCNACPDDENDYEYDPRRETLADAVGPQAKLLNQFDWTPDDNGVDQPILWKRKGRVPQEQWTMAHVDRLEYVPLGAGYQAIVVLKDDKVVAHWNVVDQEWVEGPVT